MKKKDAQKMVRAVTYYSNHFPLVLSSSVHLPTCFPALATSPNGHPSLFSLSFSAPEKEALLSCSFFIAAFSSSSSLVGVVM